MHNDFSPKTKDLFDMGGYMMDWEDGRNATEIHHILGRESSSAYNAAPLHRVNHSPEGRIGLSAIHSFEVRSKYLIKTKKFLDSLDYQPTEDDLAFLESNKKYYAKSTTKRTFPL